MPTSTTMTVVIARPAEDVFAVLSDVTNIPIWSANTIEETLITPGPLQKLDSWSREAPVRRSGD